MAEGYLVELEMLAEIIFKAAPPTSSLTWEEKGLHLLLAIAERLERLADKPLKPVLANLAQLVALLYEQYDISPAGQGHLMKAIQDAGAKGGEHP